MAKIGTPRRPKYNLSGHSWVNLAFVSIVVPDGSQCVASIYIWSSADEFVLGQTNILFVSLLLPFGIAMVVMDLFKILQGTTLDSKAVEPFLNLSGGTMHPGSVVVGKALSLGRFNPVSIVSSDVKNHLLIIDEALN